ncbi:MAG: hypothetical protein AABX73_02865 [Nanoarchaeota archaeon]
MKNRKKAQEEIVGFVLIILVVSIALFILISLFLRQSNSSDKVESADASQFLDTLIEYTTECTTNGYSYLELDELIEKCRTNTLCFNNENSCGVLKRTLDDIMEKSWQVGKESKITGYKLIVNYGSSEIISFNGPLGPTIRGAEKSLPNKILISLELSLD